MTLVAREFNNPPAKHLYADCKQNVSDCCVSSLMHNVDYMPSVTTHTASERYECATFL